MDKKTRQMMQWKDIAKQQPIDGQRILVYSPALKDHLDEFLKEGIWPVSIWNEEKNCCQDENGDTFKITMWTEFSLPSEVRMEEPKRKIKKSNNNFSFWC